MILILIKNNEQIEKDKYLNQKHKKTTHKLYGK